MSGTNPWRRLHDAFRNRRIGTRRAIAWGLPALCLTGTVIGLSVASAEGGHPGRVPTPGQAEAIAAAAGSCPALTPARLAGQVMANSGFDARTRGNGGGEGIAGLNSAAFTRWAPWPDANRGDEAANIVALAHQMCDLVGNLRLAGVGGDPWRMALAAYRTSFDDVIATAEVPASARAYVNQVAAYADWYGALTDLHGTPGPSPSVPGPASAAAGRTALADASRGPATAGPSPSRPAVVSARPSSVAAAAAPATTPTRGPTQKLSVNRPSRASSIQEAGTEPQWAFDTNYTSTRWASAYADNQWLWVDLGGTYTVTSVILRWENAYAKSYDVQVSVEGTAWTTIYTDTNGNGGDDHIAVPPSAAHFVRLRCHVRGTKFGFSLYDFEALGY
ncbi:discoidin domain-containing protein [Dactylosporangium sp. CA-092794]|uniref:discoidin domain-containing protein n=1 Tax=Dactylosporangium sp. CA-092794 TaxID=3239929 RepID=UPI003D8EC9D1